eukprot:COSAG02_NODE_2252_length_9361_cov_26.363097_7_plen_85_part_01
MAERNNLEMSERTVVARAALPTVPAMSSSDRHRRPGGGPAAGLQGAPARVKETTGALAPDKQWLAAAAGGGGGGAGGGDTAWPRG